MSPLLSVLTSTRICTLWARVLALPVTVMFDRVTLPPVGIRTLLAISGPNVAVPFERSRVRTVEGLVQAMHQWDRDVFSALGTAASAPLSPCRAACHTR